MRTPVRSFRDLEVWQAAMELGESVYRHVRELPPEERFGLAAQIRRAAISVPSNIAEGHAFRSRPRAYCRYVRIALGSFAELDTQIEMAARLNMLGSSSVAEVRGRLERVGKLLHGLLRALRAIKDNSNER